MQAFPKTALIAVILLASAAGGYTAYAGGYLPMAKATPAPTLQSAAVRTGDLVILTTASGNVLAATDAALSFRTGGLLAEVNVALGDTVRAGEGLARLDDAAARLQYEQAQINLEALLSPSARLEAELAAVNAQKALDDATDRLSRLISPEVLAAEAALAQARAPADVEAALAALAEAQNLYATEYLTATFSTTKIEPATKIAVTTVEAPTPAEIDVARANARLAERKLAEAQAYAGLLQKSSFTDEDVSALQGSAVDRLKQARLALKTAQFALDSTVLTAPFGGTVTKINANPGQTVGTTPLLVLSTLDQPMVRFFVEESDLAQVGVGQRIEVTFEGYAEKALTGTVTAIEPAMGMQEGTPVMLAWATVAPDPTVPLYAGMTANVEIISGEARHTLLVPVAALRELAAGEYAVFVVQPDGQLKLTPVRVGLKDFSTAEILAGLKAGDVVSTGSVATK